MDAREIIEEKFWMKAQDFEALIPEVTFTNDRCLITEFFDDHEDMVLYVDDYPADYDELNPDLKPDLENDNGVVLYVDDGPENYATDIGKVAEVYVHGCCLANGSAYAQAGIGIFWGFNHHYNVSEPLEGKQSINRAEVEAARRAIEQAKEIGATSLTIKAQSNFLVQAMIEWKRKWEKHNWKRANGSKVKDREDFEILEDEMKGIDVSWEYVVSHHDVYGSKSAIRLAKDAAERSNPRLPDVTNMVVLPSHVSFEEML